MGKILNGKALAEKLNIELEKKVSLISKKTGIKPSISKTVISQLEVGDEIELAVSQSNTIFGTAINLSSPYMGLVKIN